MKTTLVVTLVTALLAVPASGADAFVVAGPGLQPGLAVDAAGTAYIAWNEPADNRGVLRFCRLPRGAAQCDPTAAASITAPGTTITRPFVVVTGSRVVVVQGRYGEGVPGFSATYAFTSHDGGASFPEQRIIGKFAPNDAIAGPADTISGVTNNGTRFQNAPIDGSAPVALDGTSTVGSAELSTDHLYNGSVALVDASTPLVAFTDGSGFGQFRRYGGSGDLNDVANWTAPVDLGQVNQPRLAGGPAGLFLLGGTAESELFARKYDGTTFGPPVMLAIKATMPTTDLFQDAAGRLHAAFGHGDGDGFHLMHAVSDDGVTWRMGTVTTVVSAADGGVADTQIAAAPDHIGVVTWQGGAGTGEIRIAAVGPDAPITAGTPTPTPTPQAQPATKIKKPEGTYKVSGLPTCAQNGTTIHITIGFKRAGKKSNPVVGIRRVRKDTKGPFRVNVPVIDATTGKAYVITIRVYLKVKRGKARTRTITRTVKGC